MNDSPPRPAQTPATRDSGAERASLFSRLLNWIRSNRWSGNGEESVRGALGEIIDGRDGAETPITDEERLLLTNILDLRGRTVHDVMVPLVDIVAIEFATSFDRVVELITAEGHSRLPVYRDSLDNAAGFIHAKDVLGWRRDPSEFTPAKILRKILFVAPSMQVLELLLEMRVTRAHMALVVDEYGGVDGLVTIEDLVEEIVGEIEDEHDRGEEPELVRAEDGTYIADARVSIETMEQTIGSVVNEEEREDSDTVGGLVFALAGRVPIRGELIPHPSGIEFEILEADPRRIRKMRILGGPVTGAEGETDQ